MTALVSQTPSLRPLPYTLDLACPLSIPSKPAAAGSDWPYPTAGPSSVPLEQLDVFIRRRYYETLHLPESSHIVELVKPLLRALPQIERRHRKSIRPLLSGSTEPAKADPADFLGEEERSVVRFAVELRAGSRAALEDGTVPVPRKIADELEKREILMQMTLLLLYVNLKPLLPIVEAKQSKNRKRRHRSDRDLDDSLGSSPIEEPQTALEILMDRISVWQAVADLGLSVAVSGPGDIGYAEAGKKGKNKEEDGVGAMLGRFWKTVMVPFFLNREPGLCATFHQKVFGHPMPTKLRPGPGPVTADTGDGSVPTKRPRKPKLTRALHSKDDLLPPPPLPSARPLVSSASWDRSRPVHSDKDKERGSEMRRSLSRASSRAGSIVPSDPAKGSPPRDAASVRRSVSKTDLQTSLSRRSRSGSVDPLARTESLSSIRGGQGLKKPLIRAASSKDLFKGREVGLMRRTTSKKDAHAGLGREDVLSRSQSQSQRSGLLGRKTSGGRETQRRASGDDTLQAGTLIMATPSKPRHMPFLGGPSYSYGQTLRQPSFDWPESVQESPAQEQTFSNPRPSYIAETPTAPRFARREDLPLDGHGDDESALGELWELTDDEGDDGGDDEGHEVGTRSTMIPETPSK
ncbi:hypothetical protein IAU60_005521 [Kwoniella sp. DSM 27419]